MAAEDEVRQASEQFYALPTDSQPLAQTGGPSLAPTLALAAALALVVSGAAALALVRRGIVSKGKSN